MNQVSPPVADLGREATYRAAAVIAMTAIESRVALGQDLLGAIDYASRKYGASWQRMERAIVAALRSEGMNPDLDWLSLQPVTLIRKVVTLAADQARRPE